jgi:transposase
VSGYEALSREELIGLLVERDAWIVEQGARIVEQGARIVEQDARIAGLEARLARLERLLTRNSANSSMPPSRDDDPGRTPPAAKPEPAAGKRTKGKQKGARGVNLAWTENPTRRLDRFPEGTCECGHDLAEAVDLGVADRYQQHEIPTVAVTVTQYDQHQIRCGCGRVHTAARPDGARQGPVGYGPNLQALAVYLLVVHHIPTHRVVALLAALTGTAPSVGFVHGLLARAAGLLDAVDKRVRALLIAARAVCCDETPIRVGPKKPRPGRKKADKYLLVACTERLTHYLLGDRDLATFTEFVVSKLSGVVVHDRYQNYDSAKLGRTLVHQLCTAHLLRDLACAAETYPDAVWPGQIADAVCTLIHQANLARAHGLSRIDDTVAEPLVNLFRNGVRVGLSDTRHRGDRPGEAKAHSLLKDLRDRESDVLRFTGDLRIPPTSNQAERDLRPAKIQQNISGRLTSEDRTRDRYLIRGVLSTVTKHGLGVIEFLRDTFTGRTWMPPDPTPA